MERQFTGGASVAPDQIQIHLKIGGKTQQRVYNPIDHSIDKLSIVAKALSQISLESTADINFYVNQVITLFAPTHISLLPNISEYQMMHNMQILIMYIKSCIDTFSDIQALQLLNHNRIVSELTADLETVNEKPDINMSDDHTMIQSIGISGDVQVLSKKLRDVFNQYVQIINSKKAELEQVCLAHINQLDDTLKA